MKKTGIVLITVLIILLSACKLPFSIVLNEDTPSAEKDSAFDIAEMLKPLVKATPTPKLPPASKLDLADYALFAGDLDSAIERFQEVFEEESDSNLKAAALLGLGKSYYTRRDYASAIDAYNRLLGQFPESDSAGNAYFLLGESYFDIGEYLQAASAYARFAELKPGALDDITRTYQGNAALTGGDYNQAIFAYQAALQAVPPGNTSYLNLQIGKAYAGLED
ncbi:MAG TPA: tetratricopeptide repeat protein, partial [Pelolinea sp.]|nr:tetratricopeptide repeat protein [Pelolinea sp.]